MQLFQIYIDIAVLLLGICVIGAGMFVGKWAIEISEESVMVVRALCICAGLLLLVSGGGLVMIHITF